MLSETGFQFSSHFLKSSSQFRSINMARTRRNNRGNKSRNFHSNSPPTSVPTPPSNSGRRSAAVAAATASKASGRQKAQGSRLRSNRGRRGPNSSRKGQAISNRSTNGRGRGRTAKKDNTPLQDPSSYRDDNGEVYRRGGKFSVLEEALKTSLTFSEVLH